MDEDTEDFQLRWEDHDVKHESGEVVTEAEMCLDNLHGSYTTMAPQDVKTETVQMAAENLIFLAQDINYTVAEELDPNVECVTEEVITDDWVNPGGQERVEVSYEQITNPILDMKEENEMDVALPTDQDQYTAMRPWPCDFCSRRFRKKAALMNHMVAHQSDRPHACNLCGVNYVRKCDLMNHLKVHAFVPDNSDTMDFEDTLHNSQPIKPKKKRGRRKKETSPTENGVWENMTSARTQQWSRRSRTSPKTFPQPDPEPPMPPSPRSPPSPPPIVTDPSRPFVCKHCGVGFAREKALQSHARVHGGDSPVECSVCGELCWSREALASHTRHRHPHLPPESRKREPSFNESNTDDDMEFTLSPMAESVSESERERVVYDTVRGPELFCQDCGVAFQRADLLRRHVAAAHSYKRHDSTSSTWGEHTCEVCGETCTDALQLLAHAELHTERNRAPPPRLKRMSRGRNNTSSSSLSRQFPCKECGKVFGSRSSQQIHVRIHTGERPYACRFCWKAFADGGTLRKHERIHTGEKPYGCAVCPRAFNQRVVLREHVRSHHSAPDRRAHGGAAYCCVVCGRTLHSSSELVQHLIQHCDANTALKRQPQSGPRKYKRRRKVKADSESPVIRDWTQTAPASPSLPRETSPIPPSPPPVYVPPTVTSRRRRKLNNPPARPKMIHTEHVPKTRNRVVRQRRPPRHPADDLRVIGLHSPEPSTATSPHPSPEPRSPSPEPSPSPGLSASPGLSQSSVPSPSSSPVPSAKQSPIDSPIASPISPEFPASPSASYKCEICDLEFSCRDALLLHVPVHI